MNIADRVAVVTGGASGLGRATAEMLIAQGAKVAILDVNDGKGRLTAEETGAAFFHVDIADDTAVIKAFDEIDSELGAAQILVSCAGVAPAIPTFGRDGAHPIEAFRRTIDVNLTGTYSVILQFASRVAQPDPFEEERGIIIVTTSIAAFDGQADLTAYSASKAGLQGLILPLALDLADRKVRVMGIAPGLFKTPLLDSVPGGNRVSFFTQVPHPARGGEPHEFAHLVQSIVANPMLNGSVIRLDGALRLAPA